MSTPGPAGVAVIGEALVDVVNGTPFVGGSPLNVAVGTARLGYDTVFLGRYGRDEYGEMIGRHLRDNRVTSLLAPDALPTSVAIATLDATGSARYEFHLQWDVPALLETLTDALGRVRLVHTGSIATVLEPGARDVLGAIQRAREWGLRVTFDPNCRPSITSDPGNARAWVERFVALSDVVKASDEDLCWLYPDRAVEESAEAWRRLGPSLVVVTQGAAGALAVHNGGVVTVPARPVAVVDTVGAGDSFMAALVAAVLDLGDGPMDALTHGQVTGILNQASAAAAITVGRAGANPPTRAELAAR